MAQIKAGAPIDAFISAADKQVDELALLKLVDPDTRRVVAGNALVLVVSRDSTARLDSFEGLARAAVKRLALGEPRTVPAGEYATQVLKTLKLTDALTGRLVYGSNVRQVLDYVARGEVTAGIVYATDAREAGERVKVAATAKGEWHKPIVYPAVLVTKSGNAAAAGRFLEHLATPQAQAVLRRRGFAPAPDADAAAANEPADRRP
jgi:molybdate transport system substrate-binding protein